MNSWKGTRVHITIWEHQIGRSHLVADVTTWLDTDTMDDLFTRYNPERHRYEMRPAQ